MAWMIPPNTTAQLTGPPTAPTGLSTATANTGGTDNGVGVLWWERVHVSPPAIVLGNIITVVIVQLDVFNAYRDEARTWDALAVNADGVTTDAPSLPTSLPLLGGLTLNVTISPEGDPTVVGDLTFTFQGPSITVVPILFQRIQALPFLPEVAPTEDLEWLTKIVESDDASEKRQSLRDIPRQRLNYQIVRKDGPERQRMENLLFLSTGLSVGVPIVFEQIRTTADVPAAATIIPCQTTSFSDFRVGGLGILWIDETDFEIFQIDAVTANQITTSTPLDNAFLAGTRLMPLRIATLEPVLRSTRGHYPGGLTVYQVPLLVEDNDSVIASTAAFSSYKGKVLLDDPNFGENVGEGYGRRVTVLDGLTGLTRALTTNDVARRTSRKEWITNSAQRLWEVRQLLHALRGRQVSYYLPTFSQEFTAVVDLVSAGLTVDVVNAGYTELSQVRQPRDELRVVLKDGTTLLRTIVSASVASQDVEQLTVNAVWGQNIAVADIERIEIVEKVRSNSDKIRIQHGTLPGDAVIPVPTRSVLE